MKGINKDVNDKELEDDRNFADKVKRSIKQLEKYGNISSILYVSNVVNKSRDFTGKSEFLEKLDDMADLYIKRLEELDISYDVERAKKIQCTGIYDERNVFSRVRDIFESIDKEILREDIYEKSELKEKIKGIEKARGVGIEMDMES